MILRYWTKDAQFWCGCFFPLMYLIDDVMNNQIASVGHTAIYKQFRHISYIRYFILFIYLK